jgi:RNA polymerase sigma factor (sigma-70 family)
MSLSAGGAARISAVSDRSDPELIQACLEGDGKAWETLVNRYKRLVYSIPFKWGLQRDDAQEIFQAVWLDCFQELHSLRDVDRLQAWLVRIAVRKCYRLKEKYRTDPAMVEIMENDQSVDDPRGSLIQRLDQEQMIRMAVEKLSPRCKQVIQALFFEDPFPSYATIASRLGLSPNSVGFTRDRCLERLGKLLQELGYEN